MSKPVYCDCDAYCADCCPDIEPEYLGPEVDSPLHCGECSKPLDHSLTADGVKYVLDAIRDSSLSYDPIEGGWYDGMPHCSIVGDWARELRWYGGLSDRQTELIESFIEQVEQIERESLDRSSV